MADGRWGKIQGFEVQIPLTPALSRWERENAIQRWVGTGCHKLARSSRSCSLFLAERVRVRGKTPCRLRRQIQQRFQRAAGPFADARLNPVTNADQGNDGGGFHEIEMAARVRQQRPRAVTKRGCRAERDQRVHVRLADLDLPPGAAIKLGAAK